MPKVLQSLGGRPTVDSVEPSDHLGPFPVRAAPAAAPGSVEPSLALALNALSEIAGTAAELQMLLHHVREGQHCALPGAVAIAEKIGHLADVVCTSQGWVGYCDAQERFLSPRMLELLEQTRGASHG